MDWNYTVLPNALLELKEFRERLRSQKIILAVTLQDVQIKTFTALKKYSFRMESHKVTVLVYGILSQKVCCYLSFIILFYFSVFINIHYFYVLLRNCTCQRPRRTLSPPVLAELLLSSSSSSSSSSLLCRVFTIIYLKQTMFLGHVVLYLQFVLQIMLFCP